ncbi:pterin-4-alpha-carbinolamine dehydratase 2, mitochondrial-like isoform X3 [Triticum urartu]|uniref:pterin-4-alpha-carbinolamine dehydratase 2, mitochondrial-like isoform X3 n=1 Tax=Triticum urartu TaxID=4572 RepID=UPI0020443B0F|nr:pterin-4-alpha-carbinolamine dehydratase 2, mitochondrial-like isoform X3 [Triticum urartu]
MEERTLFRGQAPGEAAPARPSASQAVGDEAAAKVVLSKKSCLPCSSKDLQAMSEDSAKRAWKVKKFAKGLDFFQLVAAVAEEQGHHPDLHLVGWNNVKIDVWTHAVRLPDEWLPGEGEDLTRRHIFKTVLGKIDGTDGDEGV